jgi:hypothetical protein
MGADLYIKKIFDENQKQFKPFFDSAVELRDSLGRGSENPLAKKAQEIVGYFYDKMYEVGYFRDSYNGTAVLFLINLSWWENVSPLINKSGNISGKNLKTFRDMVTQGWANCQDGINNDAKLLEHLKEHSCTVDDGENSVAVWREFFTNKYNRLIEFIDTAIKLRTCIRASV